MVRGGRRKYLDCGPYKSMMAHVPFLCEDFSLIVVKGQRVLLPYLVCNDLPVLRLIPPEVKENVTGGQVFTRLYLL